MSVEKTQIQSSGFSLLEMLVGLSLTGFIFLTLGQVFSMASFVRGNAEAQRTFGEFSVSLRAALSQDCQSALAGQNINAAVSPNFTAASYNNTRLKNTVLAVDNSVDANRFIVKAVSLGSGSGAVPNAIHQVLKYSFASKDSPTNTYMTDTVSLLVTTAPGATAVSDCGVVGTQSATCIQYGTRSSCKPGDITNDTIITICTSLGLPASDCNVDNIPIMEKVFGWLSPYIEDPAIAPGGGGLGGSI